MDKKTTQDLTIIPLDAILKEEDLQEFEMKEENFEPLECTEEYETDVMKQEIMEDFEIKIEPAENEDSSGLLNSTVKVENEEQSDNCSGNDDEPIVKQMSNWLILEDDVYSLSDDDETCDRNNLHNFPHSRRSEPIRKKKKLNPNKLAQIVQKPLEPVVTIGTTASVSQSAGDTGPNQVKRQPQPAATQANQLKNPLWNYFERSNMYEAKCKMCSKVMKTPQMSTSSLIKHLRLHNPIYDNYIKEKIKYQELSGRKLPVSQLSNSYQQDFLGTKTQELQCALEEENVNDLVTKFPTDKSTNPLWNYFERSKLSEAMCKVCSKVMKTPQGITSSLTKHLRLHSLIFDKYMRDKIKYQTLSGNEMSASQPSCSTQQPFIEIMTEELKRALDSKDEQIVHSVSNLITVKSKNPLWNYYERPNFYEARCNTCSKVMKTGTQGTTTSLIRHLSLHKPTYDKYMKEKSKFHELFKRKRPHITPTAQKSSSNQQKVFKMVMTQDPSDSRDQTKVDDLVFRFIIGGLHPYSIVEEDAFKNMMAAGFPKYSVPCSNTISRTIIPKLYSKEETKLKSVLCNDIPKLQSLSFTTEEWKSRTGNTYVSLACHYLDSEFNRKIFTLTNKKFHETQSEEDISIFIKLEMENWGIVSEDKLLPIYVVTDGKRNIVHALKQTSWNHRECFAYKLQHAVKGAVNLDLSTQDMLQKIKSIVDHYHRSTAATARLEQIQTQLGMNPPKNIVRMVETRWNCELHMLERLVELRTVIDTELSTSQNSISNLKKEEWDLAEAYIQVLKSIEVITNVMITDKYPTISMIIPVLNEIETTLKNIVDLDSDQHSSENVKTIMLAKTLQNKLRTEFKQYKRDDTNKIATALDPRFKCVLLDQNSIEKKLISLAALTQKVDKVSNTKIQAHHLQPKTNLSGVKAKTNPWAALSTAAAKVQRVSADSPSAKEVKRYLEDGLVDPSVDPYLWWKTEFMKYPILSKVASRYLPIPATRASSERLFSAADERILSRRESLLPEHVEQLLFLHNIYKED